MRRTAIKPSEKLREQLLKLKNEKKICEDKLASLNKKIKDISNELDIAVNKERSDIFQAILQESALNIDELKILFAKKKELIELMKCLADEEAKDDKNVSTDKDGAYGKVHS